MKNVCVVADVKPDLCFENKSQLLRWIPRIESGSDVLLCGRAHKKTQKTQKTSQELQNLTKNGIKERKTLLQGASEPKEHRLEVTDSNLFFWTKTS